MAEQPTATVLKQYGSRVMTALYYMQHDERGAIDHASSRAILKLEDASNPRFPLLWSINLKPEEATAALDIFEATGITLDPK